MKNCKVYDIPSTSSFKSEFEIEGMFGQPFENPTPYRSFMSGLQYVLITRPDIAYSVTRLVNT